MIPTSDIGALRAFVAVAGALSFSRAADALGVSPSALSQTLRALEDRVGVRLLNRSTQSVSLTDAGRTLLDHVRPAVEELATALEQLRATDDRPAGTVRVHAFRITSEIFLAPMLARFSRDYPEVVLDVTIDDTVVDIVAAGFDVAIHLGEVIERDMVALRLGPELRQVAVASPEYLAKTERRRRRGICSATGASGGAGLATMHLTPGSSATTDAGSRLWSTAR